MAFCYCGFAKLSDYTSSHNHGSVFQMAPSNNSYLSNIAIFHFHDYGRKSTTSANHEFQFAQLHEWQYTIPILRLHLRAANFLICKGERLASYCFFWYSISGRCLQQTFDLRKAAIAIVLTVSRSTRSQMVEESNQCQILGGKSLANLGCFEDSAL